MKKKGQGKRGEKKQVPPSPKKGVTHQGETLEALTTKKKGNHQQKRKREKRRRSQKLPPRHQNIFVGEIARETAVPIPY